MAVSWLLKYKFLVILPVALMLVAAVACSGSAGPAGDTGQKGPSGDAGSAGPAGPSGPSGPGGQTGGQGPAGAPGPQGPVGPRPGETPIPTKTTPAPTATSPAPAPTKTAPSPAPTATAAPPPPTATTPKPVEDVKSGGILRNMKVPIDPASLDIHAQSGLFEQAPVVGIYDNLLRWDPDFGGDPGRRIIGDLAESWDVSPDSLTYTFHLYKNVVWQDGTPFSSDDVLASLEHMLGILDPEFISKRGGPLLKPLVESVSAPDADTIVVKLQFPTLLILPSLASDWVKILKREINETKDPVLTDPKNIIGTGPFRFKRLNRGIGFEWEKSTNYRFGPEFPYIDGMNSIIAVDRPTVIAAFITKRIVMTPLQPFPLPENIQQVKDAIGEENLETPIQTALSGPTRYILNSRVAPFKDNPDAIRAIWLAIDRYEIQRIGTGFEAPPGEVPGAPMQRRLFGDFTMPIEELLATPGLRQLNGQKHPDDLAEAKRLWNLAVPEGLTTSCLAQPASNVADPMQVFSNQLKRFLDINCPLDLPAGGTYLARGNAGDFVISTVSTGATIPDPDPYIAINWTRDGARNWGAWFDDEVENLRNQQLRETDPVKRKEQIWEIQRIAVDMTRPNPNPAIPAHVLVFHFMNWACVKNWHSGPDLFDDGRLDHVWLDDGCR